MSSCCVCTDRSGTNRAEPTQVIANKFEDQKTTLHFVQFSLNIKSFKVQQRLIGSVLATERYFTNKIQIGQLENMG